MKLLKILFALMILCNLQGCAMLGDFRSAISRWHLDENAADWSTIYSLATCKVRTI